MKLSHKDRDGTTEEESMGLASNYIKKRTKTDGH